jgi:hypothetical protein
VDAGDNPPSCRTPQFTTHNSQSTIHNSPLAIIAIEATVGPYATFAEFAQALLDGRGGTTLETVDVDLSGLRFPPNDLKHTLPQQLLILEVARRLAARHPDLSKRTHLRLHRHGLRPGDCALLHALAAGRMGEASGKPPGDR